MLFERTRWLVILLVAVVATPAPLLALGPVQNAGDTQLYIGHSARLHAQIPAEWKVMSDFGFAYGDGEGLFLSDMSYEETLGKACNAVLDYYATEGKSSIAEATWNGEPACKIDIPASNLGNIPLAAMIVSHPEPYEYAGLSISFAMILATPEHLENILPTVSFDLSTLTGPEIAHSIVDLAEANSYYTSDIDWDRLRGAAEEVRSPDTISSFITFQLVPALRNAGDNHSFLQSNFTSDTLPSALMEVPKGELRGKLGYIELPRGGIPVNQVHYVEAGLTTVEELDSEYACGWIVDLRENLGGSVSVMIQPLLPFFPDGRLVGFVDAEENHSWVMREGNRLVYAKDDLVEPYGQLFSTPLPDIADPDAPIAVLVGPHTRSAGEFTLLTLASRANTRSFGQTTAGFTTGNTAFPMLDGPTLALANAAAVDTDGNVYTGPIEPDVKITSVASGGAQSSDDTILAAESWLLEQPACKNAATPSD